MTVPLWIWKKWPGTAWISLIWSTRFLPAELEDVMIGVCDLCGNRYYGADILRAVHELATGQRSPEKTEAIPVARRTGVPL